MKTLIFSSLLMLSSLSFAEEKSPFTDIFYDAAPSVKVQLQGEEFYLLAINNVKREDIITKCEASFGAECGCMFAEKFTETMSVIGLPVADTVSLRLYKMEGHQVSTVDQAVTVDNMDELKINRELRNELCY